MTILQSIEGKYEVLAKLSEGGMGAVYKVRHTLLDEIRVVKVILPQLGHTAELSDRFLREARAASRLRHPNIAQILDFTVDDQGHELLVMEFIDGLTLKEVVQRTGPPPLGLAVEIARQALAALGYLHRRGFVHRDIAPDNLMLARDPDGEAVIKLIDLGIAKAISSGLAGADEALTQTGIFLGKPRYASPEQLADHAPIDARSDLYSFGIVLYELLTGRRPFDGRTAQELMAAHLLRPPLPFAESDPRGRVPAGMREIVLQLLAKKPEERPATAEDLADRLAAFAVPYSAADLDAILAPRPDEVTREYPLSGAVSPSLLSAPGSPPVAADATRRTVEPWPSPASFEDPVPAAPIAPIAPIAPTPTATLPTTPRPAFRLSPAALVLGILALSALGLWMARSGSTPKRGFQTTQDTRPAVQEPAASSPVAPSPLPADATPAASPGPLVAPSSDGIVHAQPLTRPEPVYPRQAQGLGLDALVTVDLEVDGQGGVIKAKAPFLSAEQPVPWNLYPAFKEAALQAARALRFQPATRDGAAIRDKVRLVIEVKER